MNETIDLDLLGRFVAVAESSSFSAAAKALGLPKSSVSRSIARLEAALGAQLLHRTTRKVALSTAGAALYERVRPLLAQVRQAVGELPERHEEPSGELRLTAPYDVGVTMLPEVVKRFTARYPSVRVDCRLTNRVVDLLAEGFDLALRAASVGLNESSLVVRKLVAPDFHLFASPAYVARRGLIRSEEEVADHDWVMFRGFKFGKLLMQVAKHVRVWGDDFFFVRALLVAGVGVGPLPNIVAQQDVAAGALVRVWPRFSESAGRLWLVYPEAKRVPRKVTAFRDVLLEYLRG